MRLYAGDSEGVAKWVGQRIPFVGDAGFGQCTAIGVIDRIGNPIAGVVFHDWQPQFKTLAFSIAADSPRWATRSIIRQFLSYPFDQCQVLKLWTATPSTNERALRLVKGVGFKPEGTLSRHFGPYGHAIISRMFKEDYVRLYGDVHGKTVSTKAA